MNLFAHKQALAGKRGFTLIEMIVAIFIFSIVMVVATGALVSILDANRKAQAVKSVMNNLNFALDSMTRSIRTGTGYGCGGASCDTTNGNSAFSFTDTNGQSVTYRFNSLNNTIERSINNGPYQSLTSPGITVTNLEFYVFGQSPSDANQPVVAIIMQGTAGSGKATTPFNLETIATQRIFDR